MENFVIKLYYMTAPFPSLFSSVVLIILLGLDHLETVDGAVKFDENDTSSLAINLHQLEGMVGSCLFSGGILLKANLQMLLCEISELLVQNKCYKIFTSCNKHNSIISTKLLGCCLS